MLSLRHLIFILLFISGPIYSAKNVNVDIDKKLAHNALKRLDNNKYSFALIEKIDLPEGDTRYKFFQYYQSVLVWNSNLVTLAPQIKELDEYELLSGNFYTHIEDDIETIIPKINEQQALHIATNHTLPHPDKVTDINIKLVVMMISNALNLNKASLVYRIDYFIDGEDPHRPHLVIDANSGEVVDSWQVPLC